MTTFTVNIKCDNAAFANDDGDDTTPESAAPELARILREIAQKIEDGYDYDKFQTIRDINGNDVGRYAIKD